MFENQALNEEGEENIPDATPALEETTEDTSEEASEQVETDGQPKKGSQVRIRELARQKNEALEENQSLKEKIAKLTGSVEPQRFTTPQFNEPQFDEEPIIKPGEEIDVLELDRRVKQREQKILQQADARAELREKQNQALNRINSETLQVIAQFPQLDPESESFDKDLSDTVTEAVEAHVRANPYSASVNKFVNKLMKPYMKAVAKEVGKETENIAKQVSQTALRPSSIRKPEKAASEKSIAELEQELGIVHS